MREVRTLLEELESDQAWDGMLQSEFQFMVNSFLDRKNVMEHVAVRLIQHLRYQGQQSWGLGGLNPPLIFLAERFSDFEINCL